MEFRVLGPLEAVVHGKPVALTRQKSRALLAYLLLHANEIVSTDRLIDVLWGESPPKTATASLQNTVSRLRRELGRDAIRSRPPGYVLELDPESLDLARFGRLVEEARDADMAERAEKLREALALWRGPALADLAFEPFAQSEIARLEELRLAAVEDRIDAELALGRNGSLVSELEELVGQNPLRERLRRQLMLVLYRVGRQADALAAYRDARRMLDEELGLEPSDELQRLERAILVHDPALAPPAPPPADLLAAAPTAVPEARKTVTVLFADVTGSTGLGDTLDPEALRAVLSGFYAEMGAVIGLHGGTVEKFAGDEVMAAFGVPVAHEDDALRAVRAAVEMQRALEALNESLERDRGVRLEMRTGINTGEVVAGEAAAGGSFVTGIAVTVGKRLEEAAPVGEILLGPATFELVRDAVEAEPLGPLELRGKAEPVETYRLVSLVEGAPAIARRLTAPMVGRDDELARLRAELVAARSGKRCRVAVVLGEAGIGKTRLVRELAASAREEAAVLVGRCVSYGEGATYLPVAEIVRQAGADSEEKIAALLAGEEDAELIARRVAELVGMAEGSSSVGDAFWAVRRFLEKLARVQPLVVVLDDVHWAEPTLLDLVEYVGEWSSEAPILLVCVARPDLLERRGLAAGWTPILLGPLPADDAATLADNLSDGEGLDENARARVVQIAEGNPLYAEQLLAYASEQGGMDVLEAVPPSVEALLAARLDRLDRDERAVLQRAAVVGREFWRGAVLDLSPSAEAASVERHLMALVRKGLVRPGRSTLAREDAFRFHHVLIRDVAYGGIPKEERAGLHERHADWLERREAGPDEIVGYHLEQAYRHRSELATPDRAARRVAEDAAERLGAAGIRAQMRVDARAAVNLFGRAAELLPERDLRRLTHLWELGIALKGLGEYDRAAAVLHDLGRLAADAGDRSLVLRAQIESAWPGILRGERDPDEILIVLDEAIPLFEQRDDDRALGRAWYLVAAVHGRLRCEHAESEKASERALAHQRRTGFSTAGSLSMLAADAYYGPTPVPEAIARCEQLLEEAADDRAAQASIRLWLACLDATQLEFVSAREGVGVARQLFEEFGPGALARDWTVAAAEIEMMADDPDAAVALLRAAVAALEQTGDRAWLATLGAALGDALYAQSRFEEARVAAQQASESAPPYDYVAGTLWRRVLGKALARAGRAAEGERLAQEAVALADRGDELSAQAKALLDLAEVMRVTDPRSEAAADAGQRALSLLEAKENVVEAKRARALLKAKNTAAPV
jgi:DNA-binding SARP family transcriptional activator/predicted ATPase